MFFDVSKADIITCKINWKMCNLTEAVKELSYNDDFFRSKPFYNPNYLSVPFQLRVYPNYKSQYGSGCHVSLFLNRGLSSRHNLKVKCSIYFIDASCNRVLINSSVHNFINPPFETSKYSIDKFLEFDGSINLLCEVEFVPYNIDVINNGPSNVNILPKPFNNMYKQEIFTDCVIKINNEKINAHRCVLASNSDVFKNMFEQAEMLEAKTGEVNIVDSSPKCVHAMIDYFYNGEINKEILEKLVYELFAIAHKYEVKSLMDKCERLMAMKIEATNFAELLNYIQLYNLPILEMACVKFIALYRTSFLESNEWRNIENLYKDKVYNLLKSVLKHGF